MFPLALEEAPEARTIVFLSNTSMAKIKLTATD
jgi:hypothetical protein